MRNSALFVIIPCYNEEKVLPLTLERLSEKMQSLMEQGLINEKSRVVLVNDGSRDRTWEIIREANANFSHIMGLCLSRNYGHQNALLAGLMFASDKCDVTISLDADLQDDLNAMDEMLKKYHNEECEIVYGVRNDRSSDSFFKRFTANSFYRVTSVLGGEVVHNHADYRLMSKRAVEELMCFEERNLFLRGMVPMLGFKTGTVLYTRHKRAAGKTKYPFFKMLSFAIEGITSLSVKPLRFISGLGLFILLVTAGMLIYSFVQQLTGNTIRGWSSTIVSIWALGGIQMLCIGVVGEYIGKIYMETKHRPRYIIKEFLDDRKE